MILPQLNIHFSPCKCGSYTRRRHYVFPTTLPDSRKSRIYGHCHCMWLAENARHFKQIG